MTSKWAGKGSANITSTCPYCFDSEVLSLRRLPTGHAVRLGLRRVYKVRFIRYLYCILLNI